MSVSHIQKYILGLKIIFHPNLIAVYALKCLTTKTWYASIIQTDYQITFCGKIQIIHFEDFQTSTYTYKCKCTIPPCTDFWLCKWIPKYLGLLYSIQTPINIVSDLISRYVGLGYCVKLGVETNINYIAFWHTRKLKDFFFGCFVHREKNKTH